MKQIGKNTIYRQIQESRFPCWNLYQLTGFRRTLLRCYNCEDCPEDADNEKKVENALKALSLTLNAFPAEQAFAIEIKASKNANGCSFYGPIEFINYDETEIQGAPQANGLSGLPNMGDLEKYGLCSTKEVEAKLEMMRMQNQKAMDDMQMQLRREILENEYKQKLAALEAEKSRLEQERKEASDGINKAVEVIKLAAPAVLGAIFGPKAADAAAAISGAQPEKATQEQPTDERYKIVESLANEIYESKLNEEQLRRMRNNVSSLIQDHNAKFYNQQAPVDDDESDGSDAE